MNIKFEIYNVLFEIHEDIQSQREKLLYAKQKIEDLQNAIKIWELEQMTDISNATDEKGKAVFSNETKRQAELEQRKQASPEYQKMTQELKSQKFEYDMAVIILQGMLDKQENARALARIEGVA